MGLYTKEIKQLVILQEVDNEILALEKNLSNVPKHLEELQNELSTTKVRFSQIKEKIDLLQLQHKKLKDEIEDDGLKIEKRKNQLLQLENQKEYHAMMREMDALEKTNRMREEEKVAVNEELGQQKEILVTTQEEINRLESEVKKDEASLNKELSSIHKKLEKLRTKSEGLCKDISVQLLEQYNFIKKKLSHPVVASISDAICNACHIKIPLQTYIEVQKSEFITTCPNCQRIIYWKDLFSPEEQQTGE